MSKVEIYTWQYCPFCIRAKSLLKKKNINFTKEFSPKYQAVKEAVLPFKRFPGSDTLLGPEMRSTGEVMGLAKDFGIAYD